MTGTKSLPCVYLPSVTTRVGAAGKRYTASVTSVTARPANAIRCGTRGSVTVRPSASVSVMTVDLGVAAGATVGGAAGPAQAVETRTMTRDRVARRVES